MIVNLYVDHLASAPPASAEEVWNETREHARLFNEAAQRIGMTPQEYAEFRNALLDGKAVYVRLPHRMDAMAGSRRGYVYAVHNAVLTQDVMGWKVQLADGAQVYVPQICGNLSILRGHAPVVASVKHAPKHVAFVPSVKPVPVPETPVTFAPPPEAPEVPEELPLTAAPVAPVTGGGFPGFLVGLPIIGGIISSINHPTTNTAPTPPPCNQGSNAMGVCQTSR